MYKWKVEVILKDRRTFTTMTGPFDYVVQQVKSQFNPIVATFRRFGRTETTWVDYVSNELGKQGLTGSTPLLVDTTDREHPGMEAIRQRWLEQE